MRALRISQALALHKCWGIGKWGFALMAAAPAVHSHAQSLAALYASAKSYDAAYQSAQLQFDANAARAEQAKAGLLPSVGFAAGVARTGFENSNPSVERRVTSQTATLSASQPLYRPANHASYEQGLRLIDQSRAQLEAAEQDLVMRTSQAYFDVLGARDTLAFVQTQKAAVAEQLAFAQRNFDVGASTITDTREAQARYDLVIAQEIAADNDLRVRSLALDQLVGRTGSQPRPLATPVVLPALLPRDAEAWVQQAEARHPAIRQAISSLDIAALEGLKAEAGHKPTLDAVASYNLARNPTGGSSPFAASSRNSAGSLGLQFNLPLFAGFSTQSRIKETLALKDKAASDLKGVQRKVAQETRTAYLGVLSSHAQVRALEAAELSSQSALDANQLGYQVGVRINIDVLNAQSQLFQTKRDLAQARYSVLLGGLRLRLANGTLSDTDLHPIDALLVP